MNYVEIVNDVSDFIRFEVDYLSKGQVIEEVTPYFAQNIIKRVVVPYEARSINVIVWVRLPNGEDREIFKDAFAKSEQRCYVAQGTSKSATCKKVDCGSIPSTDSIYTINRSDSLIYLENIYEIKGVGYKDVTSPIKIDRGGFLEAPRNAGKVQFKIYMLDKSSKPELWYVIYRKSYRHPFNICLEVSGTLKKPVIKEIPCNLENNQFVQLCCCSCCCKNKF